MESDSRCCPLRGCWWKFISRKKTVEYKVGIASSAENLAVFMEAVVVGEEFSSQYSRG